MFKRNNGSRPNTLLHSRVIIPSQLIAKNTLIFDYYKDETRLIIFTGCHENQEWNTHTNYTSMVRKLSFTT